MIHAVAEKLNRLFVPEATPVLAAAGHSDKPVVLMSTSDPKKPNRTVQGQRRRPGSSAESKGRAEAPTRDNRPSQPPPPRPPSGGQPPRPPVGGGGMSGGGFPIGGSGSGGGFSLPQGSCLAYALFGGIGVIGLILLSFLFGLFGGDDPQPVAQEPFGNISQQEQQEPLGQLPVLERDPLPTVPAPSYEGGLVAAARSEQYEPGQTWTVMLYQDADDKVLEQDIFIDFNEAERVGSTDRVNIVAQLDRYRGGFSGDGDWSDTRRYYVTQDDRLDRIGSEGQSIGEVDMSDPNELADFVLWAVENYPADRYVLIMSDHGMGWPGGWTDKAPPGGSGGRGIPIGQAIGDALYLHDIDATLQFVREQAGFDAFELVGMDACLMGHLEVFTALAPHARYAVASQEVEPAVGWAYTAFLGDLVANPDMTGADLGRSIVDSYITEDQRVTDPQARSEFVGRGPLGAPSQGELARQLQRSTTISVADLSQAPRVIDALNEFSMALQGTNQRAVAQARTYAQSFTSIWGRNTQPSYIDLQNFAAILSNEVRDPAVDAAAADLFAAIQSAVVATKNGPQMPGATGVSIYFPNSELYRSPVAGPESYIPVSRRFSEVSVWDDFLGFHYTGQPFRNETNTLAVPAAPVVAPGEGQISVSPVRLSDDVAAPGVPVTMSADVDGDNIGYIYLFAGFYDRNANSIYMADTDYIDSGETKEVNGVFYPEWGEGAFTLEFVWEPIVFALNDGENQVQALLQPRSYGVTPELAVYTVDGQYTYVDGEQRPATLLLSNGELQQVVAFQGEDATSAPREIVPSVGDQFTVYEKWLDLDASGRVQAISNELGGTIVFGTEPIVWEVLDGPIGEYTIGFIVEDLDGNQVESYTDISVE